MTGNIFVNEVNIVISGNIPKYPLKGSRGIYLNDFIKTKLTLTGNQLKLLDLLCYYSNDYNQVTKKRGEIGLLYMKRYSKSAMSKDLKVLVENNFVAVIGNIITVNPFYLMPSIKTPKMKAAIQYAWENLVVFKYTV